MDKNKNKEFDILKEKVQQLDKVVHALTRKVLSLGAELGKVKNKDTKTLNIQIKKYSKSVWGLQKPSKKTTKLDNLLKKKDSVFKFGAEARKNFCNQHDISGKGKNTEKKFKC